MAPQQSYLVIGGGGAQGQFVVEQLLNRGESKVAVYDALPLAPEQQDRFGGFVQTFVGDICAQDNTFETALTTTEATCVIHCGMVATPPTREALYPSGPPRNLTPAQRQAEALSLRDAHRRVSTDGMRRVFAAILHGNSTVKQLVYVSQADAFFDGRDRPNLRESDAEYPAKVWDELLEPALLGERMVLSFNGVEGLSTAVIRPATIYGPGRNVSATLRGYQTKPQLASTRVGDSNNLADRTYAENVAHAAILAADCLHPDHRNHKAAVGRAFFITDDAPRPMWDYYPQLWAAVSGLPPAPTAVISKTPVLMVAGLVDMVNNLRGKKAYAWKRITFLCSTRTYDITLAKTVLGYRPIVSMNEGIRKTAEWWLKTQLKICQNKRQETEHPPAYDHEENMYVSEKSPFF